MVNADFIEKVIIKAILKDSSFTALMSGVFLKEYFDDGLIGEVFDVCKEHFKEYKTIAPIDVIIHNFEKKEEVKLLIEECNAIDIDLVENREYVLRTVDEYLKDQAVKVAIMKSADIVEKNKDRIEIRSLIEDALCKTLWIDLGLNYFDQLGERLKRILSCADVKIPTYFPTFDEQINGGFPPYTLSLICAAIHGGKCVAGDTPITIKDKETNSEISVTIRSLFEKFDGECITIENPSPYNIANKICKVNNYQVKSNVGWIDIDYVMETIPLQKIYVYFTSGRFIECADLHKFIGIDNNEISAIDLKIGDMILSEDEVDEVFDVIITEKKEVMYDISLPHHRLYYTNGILSHNSQTLCNLAARQVLHGHNPVLMTLEMSEDMFAQRFDSVFTTLDINRMYLEKSKRTEMFKRLVEIKNTEGRGQLFIKQYPTGEASVTQMKSYLRELVMRGVTPSIAYVDYLQLMKPEGKSKGDLYVDNKKISEQLRALSFEFKMPVVSVSQLNREGMGVDFGNVNFTHIAESMGIGATADYIGIYGQDQDQMIYESELYCKNTKNRLGGRVGETFKFYVDKKSLKMYDETELDMWIEDADKSGDTRTVSSSRPR